jgi:hypothetical protein
MTPGTLTATVRAYYNFGSPFGAPRLTSSSPVESKPRRCAIDAPAVVEAVTGVVVALVALFSSYDHITFFGRFISVQQQWGVWLIAVSLPLVLADAQLAAGSRRRAENNRARAESEAARERARLARLDRIRNRLDRSRLAFELDPSADHRRQLQRLLTLLGSPQMVALLGRTSLQA